MTFNRTRWGLTKTGNSDTIEYQYDATNRLLLRDYPNGGDDLTFEYDCLSNRTKVYTSSLTFEYEFDLVGRMTQKKDATESLTMTFEYDAGGRRTKMTGPESGDTTWQYSVVNSMTKITNPEGDVTEFEHDAAGQRTKLKYHSGAYTDYTRDDAGHILTLHNRTSTDATISKYEYEYDVVGNRTKMLVDDSDTTSYQYDDTYQLTKGAHGTRKTLFDLRRDQAPRTCRARLVCRRDAQAAPRPMVRERRPSATTLLMVHLVTGPIGMLRPARVTTTTMTQRTS